MTVYKSCEKVVRFTILDLTHTSHLLSDQTCTEIKTEI